MRLSQKAHRFNFENHGLCLSCGTIVGDRREFCSADCQAYLKRKLDQHTGILVSLHTGFAAFYFTPKVIVLDILPAGYKDIYQFVQERKMNSLPADDFVNLAISLSALWWREIKRSNKKHLANSHVFEKATECINAHHPIKPSETVMPAVKKKYLTRLQLTRKELTPDYIHEKIKTAYRRQAKKFHPDLGGTDNDFRKLHDAYVELMAWAEKPSFLVQTGLPGKWCYDGGKKRWFPPIRGGVHKLF